MTTEDDFQAMLDVRPDDHHTRLVFADWLQDRGDERAEGYRALGRLRLRSRPDGEDLGASRRFFTWFKRSAQSNRRYHKNSLPDDWLALLEGGEQFHDEGFPVRDDSIRGEWTDYPTRRGAEDAAAIAFAELPAGRRAQLLAGEAVTA